MELGNMMLGGPPPLPPYGHSELLFCSDSPCKQILPNRNFHHAEVKGLELRCAEVHKCRLGSDRAHIRSQLQPVRWECSRQVVFPTADWLWLQRMEVSNLTDDRVVATYPQHKWDIFWTPLTYRLAVTLQLYGTPIGIIDVRSIDMRTLANVSKWTVKFYGFNMVVYICTSVAWVSIIGKPSYQSTGVQLVPLPALRLARFRFCSSWSCEIVITTLVAIFHAHSKVEVCGVLLTERNANYHI